MTFIQEKKYLLESSRFFALPITEDNCPIWSIIAKNDVGMTIAEIIPVTYDRPYYLTSIYKTYHVLRMSK